MLYDSIKVTYNGYTWTIYHIMGILGQSTFSWYVDNSFLWSIN